MKASKKAVLEKISKIPKKGSRFENLVLNRALQKLDGENFEIDGKAVYTSDLKRLIYIIGDEGTVTIPEGVEVIGEEALLGKRNLKEVIFPKTLKIIERDAFTDCDALEHIRIPANVESIENYAFGDCDHLKKVHFDGPVKALSRKAFYDCDNLREISVPQDQVKEVKKALHYIDGETEFLVIGRTEKVAKEDDHTK